MHAIHPSINHGGAMERPGNRPQAVTTTGTTTPPTGSTTITDEITLSPQAKAFLESGGPGKSGNSPAHQARAVMAEGLAPSGMSFGKVVSSIAHGVIFAPAAADDGSGAQAGDIALLDGIDPIAPVPGESSASVAPAAEEGEILPATEGSEGDATVVSAATEEAIPVAGTVSGDLDLFPVLEPIVDLDADAGLLEAFEAAIDEATDDNPDGLGGVDIAA